MGIQKHSAGPHAAAIDVTKAAMGGSPSQTHPMNGGC
jgi:hypothetical protein